MVTSDHIVFSQVGGCHSVIGFRDMCSYILSEKWYADRKHGGSDESVKMVDAVAKLIAAEIRDMKVNASHYTTPDDIYPADEDAVSLVPPFLRQLMRHLVPSKLKQESLSGSCAVCTSEVSVDAHTLWCGSISGPLHGFQKPVAAAVSAGILRVI